MKKVNANTHIEILCKCPYCDAFEDVLEDVREFIEIDLRAESIDVEIKCSECEESFIVENVIF